MNRVLGMGKGKGKWADLPAELLVEISKKVVQLEDFTCFGGVCSSWRSAATKQVFKEYNSLQLPVLMVSKRSKGSGYREFYSICKRKVIGGNVLELITNKWFVHSKGWLFTIENVKSTNEIELIHPFTRRQIQLPPINWGSRHRYTAVLSANPSEVAVFSALIISADYFYFWKSGDKIWKRVQIIEYTDSGDFSDATFYKGNYYAVTEKGTIWKLDICGLNPTPLARVIARIPQFNTCTADGRVYLVDLLSDDDKLFVVVRQKKVISSNNNVRSSVIDYAVFEVDLIKENSYLATGNLGDMAIFVSNSPSISVKASQFPGLVKPNCIYFVSNDDFYTSLVLGRKSTDGIGYNKGLLPAAGVYDMEEASFKPHDFQGSLPSDIVTATWVTPTFE